MGRDEAGISVEDWADSGWVGAGDEDDLDGRLMAEDEPVDEREPHVMTALGPIEPAALGITLIGAWGTPLVGPDRDPGTALLQLEQLYATGVRAVVELHSANTDSRRADLAWLSARSPVHLLTSAGVVRTEPVAGNTPGVSVRAGLQILVAASSAQPAERDDHLPQFINIEGVRATMAGEATEMSVPLTMVADPLTSSAEGVRRVLEAGFRLALIAGDDPATMPAVAARFKELADLGFGDRLALGYAGDPIEVMERMPIFLMEVGFTSIEVRQILVDNPLGSLLIRGKQDAIDR